VLLRPAARMEMMMDEADAFRAKLEELDRKIRDARERLTLAGLFDRGHRATKDELDRRLRLLREMLDSEVTNLEAHGVHVHRFQEDVLIWLNRIGFDR